MSTFRTWTVGAAIACVVLVLGAWFLLVSPKRAQASNLKTERVSQLTRNNQLKLDIAQLKAESASLPAKQAELAVIQRQLPSNPALPALIRSLSSIANDAGPTLTSIAPGQPTALATAQAPVAGSPTTSAAGASASNVVAIPVTIVTSGSYAENELFLQKVQTSMTRALLVQGLTLADAQTSSGTGASSTTAGAASADSGETLIMTITGEVFVLQPPSAATATTGTAATAGTAASVTPPKTTGSAN
jgi:type IV pilus assembly protein PilO